MRVATRRRRIKTSFTLKACAEENLDYHFVECLLSINVGLEYSHGYGRKNDSCDIPVKKQAGLSTPYHFWSGTSWRPWGDLLMLIVPHSVDRRKSFSTDKYRRFPGKCGYIILYPIYICPALRSYIPRKILVWYLGSISSWKISMHRQLN